MSRVPQSAEAWFAARRGPHDASLEQAFLVWHADPDNARAYAQCERLWALAGEALTGMEFDNAAPKRRRFLGRAAAAAVVAGAAGWFAISFWSSPPMQRYETASGEQRVVRLEDGSEVTLNTRTTLEVALGVGRRELRLVQGEAYFEVAHDAARPFIVETPLGTARAVGTRFNVLIDGTTVEVATTEGKVLVRTPVAATGGVLSVAGTRATLRAGAGEAELGAADLGRIENWRARRVEFDRVRLDEALREFSRYTDLPVRAGSPEIAALRVSAVLKAGDLSALGTTLEGGLGLALRRADGGWLVERAD